MSIVRQIPILGAIATTAVGAHQLTEGDIQKGVATTALGMQATNMVAHGLDQPTADMVTKSSALGGIISVIGTGVANVLKGLSNPDAEGFKRMVKGGCQVAIGASLTEIFYSHSAETISKIYRTFAIGTLSAAFALIGVKDILKGNYVRGALETGVGIAGAACAVAVALAPNSGEIPEQLVPRDPSIPFQDVGRLPEDRDLALCHSDLYRKDFSFHSGIKEWVSSKRFPGISTQEQFTGQLKATLEMAGDITRQTKDTLHLFHDHPPFNSTDRIDPRFPEVYALHHNIFPHEIQHRHLSVCGDKLLLDARGISHSHEGDHVYRRGTVIDLHSIGTTGKAFLRCLPQAKGNSDSTRFPLEC